MEYTYHPDGGLPQNNEVFVFGSNDAGRHGAGAAKAALQFGAEYGVGDGMCGRTYAIPTKDFNLNTKEFDDIVFEINLFIRNTYIYPDLTFYITRVGCGLAGLNDSDVAPLFKGCNDNCIMPEPWRKYFV